MVAAFVIGILMLYLRAQNDLYSPSLFLFKAIFFPLSLVLLIKTWLFAFLVTKTRKGNNYRKWPAGVALFLTLLFLPHLLPNWQQSPQFSEIANQQGFSVATFSAMTRSRNASDIKKFIQAYQPEVLCLQEVNVEDMQALSGLYPFHHRHGESNLVILSKFPLKEVVKNQERQQPLNNLIINSLQSIELIMPGERRINILNVHMPRQYRVDGNFAKTLKSIQSHTETDKPIIFCGDFNMTPQHTFYSHLTQQLGLSDAQLSQTWEYGFTFPNANRNLARFGTWVRIDYLFSRGFYHGNTKVVNVSNLSDHQAVLSKFSLAK